MQKLSFRSGSGSDNNFTRVYDASESQEAGNSSMNTQHRWLRIPKGFRLVDRALPKADKSWLCSSNCILCMIHKSSMQNAWPPMRSRGFVAAASGKSDGPAVKPTHISAVIPDTEQPGRQAGSSWSWEAVSGAETETETLAETKTACLPLDWLASLSLPNVCRSCSFTCSAWHAVWLIRPEVLPEIICGCVKVFFVCLRISAFWLWLSFCHCSQV